ncbi:Putative glycosyltransferase EpsE [Croceibacterium atlanticum]|uniref:Glycosyltransferase EpsE n=2 Tax=Croceibacterium atlanticum TaxID=1267766 RepID=A0A0F7KT74_9SPHN|nr:glycosyltransferase family 2 protein [Croceibacterium atlanticum]AKH42799.1 Putative glycosyltransferase EpsE [Croceibacterium atlanticum]
MPSGPSITVIIAAYNAADTIGRALASALASPHVTEVVVVDDASSDDTLRAAQDAGGGDARLKILQQDRNRGPSAARNRALEESTAPYIAVLDADDYFLPGRFEAMLREPDWDLCADNILFVANGADDGVVAVAQANPAAHSHPCDVSFETFVLGNISQKGRWRGELGFLKTVLRREFLDRHDLRYDENCRLGEDFLLYAQALAKGGRFKVIGQCGYAALLRDNSLSARHGTGELKASLDAQNHMLGSLCLTPSQASALRKHRNSTRRKWIHRAVLDEKNQYGLLRGVIAAATRPSAAVDIMADYTSRPSGPDTQQRFLLSPLDLERIRQGA